MIDTDGCLEVLLVVAPVDVAHVALHHKIPLLCGAGHVKLRKLDLVRIAGALGAEKMLTPIELAE